MASKQKETQEGQVLDLLKSVLPKAVSDPKLAAKIYSACEKAITSKARLAAFETFCQRCNLHDLEASTIDEVKRQFEHSFGNGTVSIVPHRGKKALSVEVILPDETFEGVLKVNDSAEANQSEGEEGEPKPTMVAFPVCLEGDPELVWILGRQENLSPSEASMALAQVQEEFWESKAGQKLLRDRVERSFPEFIGRVPSKVLAEVGLKRHYKEPEAIKTLKALKPQKRTAKSG
jgi:hypothetical protein